MNRGTQKKTECVIAAERAKKLRIGIVVAKFNEDITEKLLEGAMKTLLETGLQEKNITLVRVPGGFEVPIACKRLAISRKKPDAIIAIGCVIRGDTDHYVYIAGESSRGVMDVMLETDTLITNCILTVNTLKQAQERCGKVGNKGSEAALAALEMMG